MPILQNIARQQPPNSQNGKGLIAFLAVGLASEYGEASAVETKTDNVITAIDGSDLFYHFDAERSSLKYSIAPEGGEDSKSYDFGLEAFIAGITPFKSKLLSSVANLPLVLCFEDRNGNARKVGEKYDGVSLSVTEETETRNGYMLKFELKGMATLPAFLSSKSILPYNPA